MLDFVINWVPLNRFSHLFYVRGRFNFNTFAISYSAQQQFAKGIEIKSY